MKIRLLRTFILMCFYQPMLCQNSQVIQSINIKGAETVLDAAIAYAQEHKSPGGSIAIVDAGGHLVAFRRLDYTFAASAFVAIEKAKTAALFKTESKKLEDAINSGRQALITVGHIFLQGGVPILENNQIIGAIGVSGAMNADQDRAMALAGAESVSPKKQ